MISLLKKVRRFFFGNEHKPALFPGRNLLRKVGYSSDKTLISYRELKLLEIVYRLVGIDSMLHKEYSYYRRHRHTWQFRLATMFFAYKPVVPVATLETLASEAEFILEFITRDINNGKLKATLNGSDKWRDYMPPNGYNTAGASNANQIHVSRLDFIGFLLKNPFFKTLYLEDPFWGELPPIEVEGNTCSKPSSVITKEMVNSTVCLPDESGEKIVFHYNGTTIHTTHSHFKCGSPKVHFWKDLLKMVYEKNEFLVTAKSHDHSAWDRERKRLKGIDIKLKSFLSQNFFAGSEIPFSLFEELPEAEENYQKGYPKSHRLILKVFPDRHEETIVYQKEENER